MKKVKMRKLKIKIILKRVNKNDIIDRLLKLIFIIKFN